MNLVIFGPPGAGKGTQSNIIVKKYKMYQLSTGELLRNEIRNNTELGKKIDSIINLGNLVSDEIVSDLIEKFIADKKFQFVGMTGRGLRPLLQLTLAVPQLLQTGFDLALLTAEMAKIQPGKN